MPQTHTSVGWLHRTDGQPPYIEVSIGSAKETFSDSTKGSEQAAQYITDQLQRDDWTLQEMAFLGYRIRIPII